MANVLDFVSRMVDDICEDVRLSVLVKDSTCEDEMDTLEDDPFMVDDVHERVNIGMLKGG